MLRQIDVPHLFFTLIGEPGHSFDQIPFLLPSIYPHSLHSYHKANKKAVEASDWKHAGNTDAQQF